MVREFYGSSGVKEFAQGDVSLNEKNDFAMKSIDNVVPDYSSSSGNESSVDSEDLEKEVILSKRRRKPSKSPGKSLSPLKLRRSKDKKWWVINN